MQKSITSLTLVSTDGEKFQVDVEVAKMSTMLDNMITQTNSEPGAELPVPNITGQIMRLIIQWCEQHRNDQEPEDSDTDDEEDDYRERVVEISKWDQDFLNVEKSVLFEIIIAANFLDIPRLLEMACKTVANMMRGKTAEEIRKEFEIDNDFTPEEELEIKRQNSWVV